MLEWSWALSRVVQTMDTPQVKYIVSVAPEMVIFMCSLFSWDMCLWQTAYSEKEAEPQKTCWQQCLLVKAAKKRTLYSWIRCSILAMLVIVGFSSSLNSGFYKGRETSLHTLIHSVNLTMWWQRFCEYNSSFLLFWIVLHALSSAFHSLFCFVL